MILDQWRRELAAAGLVLAVAAGLVALLATRGLLPAVTALVPGGLPRVEPVRVDPAVVVFTLGVAALRPPWRGRSRAAAMSPKRFPATRSSR
jgi:hypothetical protein